MNNIGNIRLMEIWKCTNTYCAYDSLVGGWVKEDEKEEGALKGCCKSWACKWQVVHYSWITPFRAATLMNLNRCCAYSIFEVMVTGRVTSWNVSSRALALFTQRWKSSEERVFSDSSLPVDLSIGFTNLFWENTT